MNYATLLLFLCDFLSRLVLPVVCGRSTNSRLNIKSNLASYLVNVAALVFAVYVDDMFLFQIELEHTRQSSQIELEHTRQSSQIELEHTRQSSHFQQVTISAYHNWSFSPPRRAPY